jgi:hypothetical protein
VNQDNPIPPADDDEVRDPIEAVRAELRGYVDHIVSKIRVPRRRRSAIREELTAHLMEIFAHELARAPADARAAFEAALRRFGDGDALSNEIQASVPALEQMLFLLFNRERRMWRLMIGVGFVVILLGTSILLPALGKIRQLGDVNFHGQPVMTLALGVMIATAIVMVGVHLLGWGIARAVRKTT